jgi:two-component system phosphate regulon response regulator PhoB
MKARLFLVEDEPGLRQVTRVLLEREGYRVDEAGSAEEALMALKEDPLPELLLSDINLPGLSGLKLCEILRGEPRTASLRIILLTVLGKGPEKVRGLKIGADDYITKPYEPAELLARVEAILRRNKPLVENAVLTSGTLRVDLESRKTYVKGRAVDIPHMDFELLTLFLKNKGKLLTRQRLSRVLWRDEVVVTENALTAHIKTLRRLLGTEGRRIETIVIDGYRWNDD